MLGGRSKGQASFVPLAAVPAAAEEDPAALNDFLGARGGGTELSPVRFLPIWKVCVQIWPQ